MTVTRIAAGEKDKFRRASEPIVNDFAATHRLGKEVDWIRAAA